MKKFFLNLTRVIFLTIIGSSVAHAQFEGPLYDVSEFEVYGLKLGMSPEQAEAALINSLGKDKKIQKNKTGSRENRKYSRIFHGFRGFVVSADFSRVLGENNELIDIVEKIRHEDPIGRPALLARLIEQYGPATGAKKASNGKETHYWCTKLVAFRGEECVPDVANIVLRHNGLMLLTTEIYTYASNERKFANDLQAQFQPFSEDNLFVNMQNESAPADAAEQEFISGFDNCSELWTSFLNWHARILTIGADIDDAESHWIRPLKVGALTLDRPPLDRNFFMKRQVQPASNIDEFVGVAVVCNKYDEYIAAQYLSKQGDLGKLYFTETDTRGGPKSLHKYGVWHWPKFVFDKNDKYFETALENRLFTKLPTDYAAQFSRAVDNQAQVREQALQAER